MGGIMSKHTPEPWHTMAANEWVVMDSGNANVCSCFNIDSLAASNSEHARANARRIVACVNACRGLSIENLENPKYVACLLLDPAQLEER